MQIFEFWSNSLFIWRAFKLIFGVEFRPDWLTTLVTISSSVSTVFAIWQTLEVEKLAQVWEFWDQNCRPSSTKEQQGSNFGLLHWLRCFSRCILCRRWFWALLVELIQLQLLRIRLTFSTSSAEETKEFVDCFVESELINDEDRSFLVTIFYRCR